MRINKIYNKKELSKEKEKLDKNYKRLQDLTDKFNEQVSKLINK